MLGGAGFIGGHLAARLAAEGHALTLVDDLSRGRRDAALEALAARPNVRFVEADLTRAGALDALPRDWDQVYMLAAVVGVRNVETDPARVVRVNTLSLLHLLDWMPGRGEVLFFASTSETYAGGVAAGHVPVPTPEAVPLGVPDVAAPRFAYAASKLLGEAAVIHTARARGLRAVIGRFHNVYGPRMGADHVIPELSLRALRREDPFRVFGAEQRRAFCHVADAVEAMTRLLATEAAWGQVVNIGNDAEETQIGELVDLVLRTARFAPRVDAAARAARLGGAPLPRHRPPPRADRLRPQGLARGGRGRDLRVVPRVVGARGSRPVTAPRRVIPNAVPHLAGNEWKYVKECLDTNWVSSAGPFVDRFEREVAQYLGVPHAVATVNGTAAIHVALLAAGVAAGDEVLVPTFTFVATANAVAYCGAHPVFLDSEETSWGLDPVRVAEFLDGECEVEGGRVVNRRSGRTVRAHAPGASLRPPVRSRSAARAGPALSDGGGGGLGRGARRALSRPRGRRRRPGGVPLVQRQQDHHHRRGRHGARARRGDGHPRAPAHHPGAGRRARVHPRRDRLQLPPEQPARGPRRGPARAARRLRGGQAGHRRLLRGRPRPARRGFPVRGGGLGPLDLLDGLDPARRAPVPRRPRP